MAKQEKTAKLALYGRWDFEELMEMTRDYIQLYGFAYSLSDELPAHRVSEIEYIYGKFPWRGGFSTVNFFSQLFHNIPPPSRPKVLRIQYASPGFIEISAIAGAALAVAGFVKALCVSINAAHELYRNIQRRSVELDLSKINLAKEQLNLTRAQIEFCGEASGQLTKVLGLSPSQDALLEQRTQGNKVMKTKLLLSVFRRAINLADKQVSQMLNLGEGNDE
ncbi:MAG: hypothetical protein IT585_11915 [candidate division Zixibacteria bacterium]|jgi:hypothetical protein|nr:hypothetical protein [candidate division Zixibacteria bacterium]